MSNDGDDAQARAETTPLGQPPAWGGQPQGQPQWGPPAPEQDPYGQDPYGRAPYGQNPYGQHPYGQAPYGQDPYAQNPYDSNAYGQNPYGQPAYGPNPYGPNPYGQNPYGQNPYGQDPYGPYGTAQPARPGTVITAAVLGLVHGALGLLVTVACLAGGAVMDDLVDAIADTDPTVATTEVSTAVDSLRAVLVVVALLALAWTVVMVWGSVLALRGRSRVLLLVGSSIAVAATGLFFLFALVGVASGPEQDGQAGGVLFLLLFFLAALAMLVLLCLRSAAQYFAVHRRRRALSPR